MFARLYLGIIVSLLLLGGSVAAAPAMVLGSYGAPVIEAPASTAENAVLAGIAAVLEVADHVNDTPPLMTEIAAAGLSPRWLCAWTPQRTPGVLGIRLIVPEEPPKRLA